MLVEPALGAQPPQRPGSMVRHHHDTSRVDFLRAQEVSPLTVYTPWMDHAPMLSWVRLHECMDELSFLIVMQKFASL
jgi:hypothetical protein